MLTALYHFGRRRGVKLSAAAHIFTKTDPPQKPG